ncbi:hypothetical protein J2810_000107 [Chryseobacterium rhizosphaerae]|uniref:DUF3887 domain-containing protein n=1 Tax=Chryseobacterium rhizosphaerae TaxID=395937 RepID=UPI0028604564|nr:DUF3887 domain-containing protein [Chryseobacterium rhizosphaerae]MDR6544085.1 hypothetical protein [Chryseobacterium rhizosphaerae]
MKIILIFLLFPIFCLTQNKKDIGKDFIEGLYSEKIEKSYSYLDSSITAKFSLEQLKATLADVGNQFGNFKGVIEVNNENNIYYYYCDFEKTKIDMMITFNDANKIAGFYYVPHKSFDTDNTQNKNTK